MITRITRIPTDRIQSVQGKLVICVRESTRERVDQFLTELGLKSDTRAERGAWVLLLHGGYVRSIIARGRV